MKGGCVLHGYKLVSGSKIPEGTMMFGIYIFNLRDGATKVTFNSSFAKTADQV